MNKKYLPIGSIVKLKKKRCFNNGNGILFC